MTGPGGASAGELPEGALGAVVAAVDAANSADPNVIVAAGRRGPKELIHSELVTGWVRRLCPEADPAQLVAARAHHLRRWERPRSDFPAGRAGYLRWRAAAKLAHAEAVGEILEEHGAGEAFVDRVVRIVRKDGLGSDPAVQVHEDALCLVFLETQLDDLIDDLGQERVTEVLRRTLGKMSPAGLEASRDVSLSEMGRSALSGAVDANDRTGAQ